MTAARGEGRRAGDRLYVISGCSGSGKSALIAALAERGEAIVTEPGRDIVKAELQSGGDGLPWANAQRFLELCAERAIGDFDRHATGGRRTFFDRGFIDVAAGVARAGFVAPESLTVAVRTRRYAARVFLSPPRKAIFRPDAERRHGFDEAEREYHSLDAAYRAHGYEVVYLPQAPVLERVEFVLDAARA